MVIDHDEKRSSFFVQRIDVAAVVQLPNEAQIGKVQSVASDKSDDEPKRLIATEPPLSCSGVLISGRPIK
jgi:hypothetical protein